MKKHFYTGLILLVITIFDSCDTEEVVQEKVKAASVGSIHLYQEELIKDVPSGLSKEDSLLFIDNLVANWIKIRSFYKKQKRFCLRQLKM